MKSVLKSFIPKRISNKTVLTVYDWFRKLSRVSDSVVARHRETNRKVLSQETQSPLKAQPGFIENQKEWSEVQIGCGKNATMQYAGCGVFAVYNALYALKGEAGAEKLLKLIARFEKKGLALKGRLGVSPKAIYEYFQENGFDTVMTIKQDEEYLNKIGKDYTVTIVTAYNDKEDITQEIHTVCVTKNLRGEYFAHNVFYKKNNQYTALPAGDKGFASLQETVEKLSKNPQVISVTGIRSGEKT